MTWNIPLSDTQFILVFNRTQSGSSSKTTVNRSVSDDGKTLLSVVCDFERTDDATGNQLKHAVTITNVPIAPRPPQYDRLPKRFGAEDQDGDGWENSHNRWYMIWGQVRIRRRKGGSVCLSWL